MYGVGECVCEWIKYSNRYPIPINSSYSRWWINYSPNEIRQFNTNAAIGNSSYSVRWIAQMEDPCHRTMPTILNFLWLHRVPDECWELLKISLSFEMSKIRIRPAICEAEMYIFTEKFSYSLDCYLYLIVILAEFRFCAPMSEKVTLTGGVECDLHSCLHNWNRNGVQIALVT